MCDLHYTKYSNQNRWWRYNQQEHDNIFQFPSNKTIPILFWNKKATEHNEFKQEINQIVI